MKKRFQKMTAVLLAVLLLFTAVPFSVGAAEATQNAVGTSSGTTGDCTWTLYDNGTLIISGNGEMDGYFYNSTLPWGRDISTVIIDNGVTNIGYCAFSNCTEITSVIIGNGVLNIGYHAFDGCTGLTSLTFGDSVTRIEEEAFDGCKGLKSITFPDSLTGIGDWAFSGCSDLASITLPDSVTNIGEAAFSGCSGLANITFPDSLTNIGINAFDNTAWYKNQPDGLVYAGKVAYKYKGTMPQNTSIVIKSGTKILHESVFESCTNLKSVTIPDSVTNIEYGAFRGCSNLTNVSIGSGLTNIGPYVFYGCTGLTSISIPDSVTYIGSDAFLNTGWYDNQSDGLVYAGKVAYKFKGSMQTNSSITISEGTKGIAASAFADCSGLTNIIVPDTVIDIGSSAFRNTLWYNNKPDGLVYIGKVAYKYKGRMPDNTSIEIQNGIKSIACSCFSNCTELKNLVIPSSVISIGSGAFFLPD